MTFDERIAIVGMHVKLPTGIDTCDGLWRLLTDGRDVFTRGQVSGRHVPLTSHIADAHDFAAERFGISEFEATLMDPQHRLLLEMSWECLETAGTGQDSVTGVFTSCSPSALLEDVLLHRPDVWARNYSQVLEGSHGDYLATRIAYRLGLTGPAMHIGTGCSSSLVALNQAVQALNAFQCDRALVASASIHAPTETGYEVREGGIYSADGYCRPFSDDANGTVPGNGAVVVLLKRLEDAIADGDHVHALVLGSAVNNDGNRKVGFAAPSVEGQLDCVLTALDVAEVDPAEVRYLEAHGTGTRVGDPIELRALAKAYGPAAPGTDRFVGSVKANIGHCDVAAGLFGLVKAALILDRRTVPPQINVTAPTTEHDWSDGSLRIARDPVDLGPAPGEDTPLLAGVSSLGVGGTNAHVILGDAHALRGADGAPGHGPRPVVRIGGRRTYRLDAPASGGPQPTPDHATEAAEEAVTERADGAAVATDTDLLELFSRYASEPLESADDDFFDRGGDSLGLIYLLDDVKTRFGTDISVEEFTRRPTVSSVRELLAGTAGDGGRAAVTDPADAPAAGSPQADRADADDAAAVTAAVAARLEHVVLAEAGADGTDRVLLTGASGFVGSFVLAELLARGTRVVCLLRGGSGRREELVGRLRDFGLWDRRHDERLEIADGDVAAPGLGLGRAAFDELAGRVDWVVHSAAAVNHVYPYEQLADVNSHSAVGVVEFAAAVRRKRVTYVSTSAVFESPAYPPGTEIDSGRLTAYPPARLGYSRSKAVAEAYFAHAGDMGLSVSVVRIPNVFGDRGTYAVNRSDAIWSWTRAIVLTGRYPASFDRAGDELFQALPADVAARVIVEPACPDAAPGCRIVNAIPNLVCSSRSLLAALRAAGHHPQPLPDQEWYALVSRLDPREVWVAAVAARLAERPEPGAAQRLHRFLLDEEPEVSEVVNAHAVWAPKDLARYLAVLTDPAHGTDGGKAD
jgi:thioester reductase-like protein